jgi:hypothetical protein
LQGEVFFYLTSPLMGDPYGRDYGRYRRTI